ncbi:FAD:protein FMN transferase [Ideonella sp. DXS29W]|uniref:FAD:protein FMN transferase n=1 Tax=Ideonella lacteola TaxID=2984193 RepID=A0ABU9BQF3_9BURK
MFSSLSALRSRFVATFASPAPVAEVSAGWLQREEAIMGTAVAVELWADDRRAGEAAMAAVIEEMRRIDRTMSPHKPDSELSHINRDAGRMPVRLSDEMCALIGRAIEFSRWSDGAFDITYASAGQLYDYRAGVAPDDAALAPACEAIGWQQLLLDDRQRTLQFGKPGMRIDLGGFAKGHAVDRCIAILKARGIEHAMVSAGGDSHVLGDRRGRPWMIAVRDPRRASEVVALLPLQDTAVSTSGDYERFFEKAGVRHHHLIDPRTGRSPSAVRSVTILAQDGLTSEALSKTVFVLGPQRGMALINSLSGVDAVIVDASGALHYSSGLLRHA